MIASFSIRSHGWLLKAASNYSDVSSSDALEQFNGDEVQIVERWSWLRSTAPRAPVSSTTKSQIVEAAALNERNKKPDYDDEEQGGDVRVSRSHGSVHERRQALPRNGKHERQLAQISHTTECIGVANQRKPLCRNNSSSIRGAPRCRRSVARICLALHA